MPLKKICSCFSYEIVDVFIYGVKVTLKTIAGSYVQDGTFERNCSVRLTRDGIVIFDGPLASLKRFKDDVKEVRAGYECGFVFENYNDIKEGDLVEAYKMVEIERK